MVSALPVVQEKILLPLLHLKIGPINEFLKALDKESKAFKHLVTVFPKFSEANIKGEKFGWPKIKKLMKDHEFRGKLSVLEKRGWQSFVLVVNGFL